MRGSRLRLLATAALGWLILSLWPGRRQVLESGLARAWPGLSARRRQRLARTAVVRIAAGLVARSKVCPLGLEHLLRARAEGRGVLILTLHAGPHEATLRWAGRAVGQVVVVGRPLPPGVRQWIHAARRVCGVQTVPERGALATVAARLARGAVVVMVLDQNTPGGDGVFVPFFGRLASTSGGLAWLAARTGAPVVPAEPFFGAGQRALVRFHPKLAVPSMERAARDAATAMYTETLEAMVRRHPAQWLWTHRRWKTRPKSGDEGVRERRAS